MRLARVAGGPSLVDICAAELGQQAGKAVLGLLHSTAGVFCALRSSEDNVEVVEGEARALVDGDGLGAVHVHALAVDLDSFALGGDLQFRGGSLAQAALQSQFALGFFQLAHVRIRDLQGGGVLEQGCVCLLSVPDEGKLVGDDREASTSTHVIADVLRAAQSGAGGREAGFRILDLLG